MAYRGFRLALVFIVIVASGLSFLALRDLDESAVLGPGAILRIDGSEHRASAEAVAETVIRFSHTHGVDVAREVPDLVRPEESRTLYLTLSGPSSERRSWLVHGYPAFSKGITTRVTSGEHPLAMDPRGTYLIFASPTVARDLARAFTNIGLSGHVTPYFTVDKAAQFFGHGAFLWCFLVSALVVTGLIGASALGNARAYGVLRLHGAGPWRAVRYDSGIVLRQSALPLTLVSGIIVVALWRYNGAHHLGLFALVSLGFSASLIAMGVVAYLLALALVWRSSIQESVKGRIHTSTPLIGSYLVRVLAITASVVACISCLDALTELTAREHQSRLWHQAGTTSALLLNGSLGRDTDRLEQDVGSWLTKMDREGKVSIAAPSTLGQIGLSQTPHVPVLVVNDTYLKHHFVSQADGTRLRASSRHLTVVRPMTVPSTAGKEITDWLNLLSDKGKRQVQHRKLARGQDLFTYGAGMTADTGSPTVRDPVIVALPTTPFISPAQYTAWASQHAVLFPDPQTVMEARKANETLRTDILGVEAVASRAALETRDNKRDAQLSVWNLTASLVVVNMSAISSGLLLFLARRQVIFVRFLHGWTWKRTHRRVLATEGLTFLCVPVVIALTQHGSETPLADASIAHPWYTHPLALVSAAASISLAATACTLLTLQRLTTQHTRDLGS